MTPKGWLALGLLIIGPIAVCYGLAQLEFALRDTTMQSSGSGDLTESTKKIIEMQSDLAKLFIGFATSVIGGIAYYVKSRRTEFDGSLSPLAIVAMIAALAACIASVFFGQLWLSAIVKELAGHNFDPSNPSWEVALPQGGQYLTFIAALVWASCFIVLQERHRIAQANIGTGNASG